MSVLKRLFSVENKNIHKEITVLGLKFKIKSNKLVIKSLKQELKNLQDYIEVLDNYEKVLNCLKEKIGKEKINVIFYSNELQKWTYNSLYKEFEKSEYFEPLVVITPLKRIPDAEKENEMSKQYDFYKNLGCKVEYGYKNNEYLNLKNLNPDIVFYQQMWDVPDINKPAEVSKYSLTAYCPYGSQIAEYKSSYKQNFHKYLWLYICENDLNIKRFESYKKGNSRNCKSFGYPKLDVYIEKRNSDGSKYWKNPEKIKIIYAPHHSFGKSNLNLGTFIQNGKFILELAHKYSDKTTWIFKPHPRLKFILEHDKLMNKKEIEKYWEEWDTIGKVCEDGDYWDIFTSSDLMITDCASFLIEYLPTGKPLLRLINKNALALNEFAMHFISQYYNSHSNEELEKLFVDLAINKNDPKREERKKLISELIDFNEPSAVKIMNYLFTKLKD